MNNYEQSFIPAFRYVSPSLEKVEQTVTFMKIMEIDNFISARHSMKSLDDQHNYDAFRLLWSSYSSNIVKMYL